MKLSKREIWLVVTAIEALYAVPCTKINEVGLKALAKVQNKMMSELLPMPAYEKGVVERITEDLKKSELFDKK